MLSRLLLGLGQGELGCTGLGPCWTGFTATVGISAVPLGLVMIGLIVLYGRGPLVPLDHDNG